MQEVIHPTSTNQILQPRIGRPRSANPKVPATSSQFKCSVDFIVPVVSVVLMFGAILAIGIKLAFGPSWAAS
jgi:hypothetical protein